MYRARFGFAGAGLVSLVACLVGCGGGEPGRPELPSAPVKGTVSYQSKPVKEGSITFENREAGTAVSGLIKDGNFEIKSVPVGKYEIYLSPPSAPPSSDPGKPNPAPDPDDIPKKYRQIKTSELKEEVKQGSPNDFKFELK